MYIPPIDYYINESKRTIVATIDTKNYFDRHLARSLIAPMYKRMREKGLEKTPKYESFLYDMLVRGTRELVSKHLSKTFTAKAKCAPGDVWDEELGLELARARLLQKWGRKVGCLFFELGQWFGLLSSFCASEKADWDRLEDRAYSWRCLLEQGAEIEHDKDKDRFRMVTYQ